MIDSHKVKSYHNVGGLPKDMKLKLLEPLEFLFKDEVLETFLHSLGAIFEISYLLLLSNYADWITLLYLYSTRFVNSGES